MNQAWGSLWDMLRATEVATATGDDAAYLQEQGGVVFAGWPATRETWETGYRRLAFAIRGNREVFYNWLADVLAEYSEVLEVDITASPGLDSASFTAAHQNRWVRFAEADVTGEHRIFFTGALDGTELELANSTTYFGNAAEVADGVTTVTVEFLPFVAFELQPGIADSLVFDPTASGFVFSKGEPCVLEVVLCGDFPTLLEDPPYLHEDGTEDWATGTSDCVLYESGELEDEVGADGIYLYDDDALPRLTSPIRYAILPSGVHVRVLANTT